MTTEEMLELADRLSVAANSILRLGEDRKTSIALTLVERDVISSALRLSAQADVRTATIEALEKIAGRREYTKDDFENAANYKRSEGVWTVDEYLADAALAAKSQADVRPLPDDQRATEDMTLARNVREATIAECGTLLWCCHVRGPDEVYAAPDYESALAWADILNAMNWRDSGKDYPKPASFKDPTKYEDCLIKAVPAIWPHSAESHAEDLPKSIAGFADPLALSDAKQPG